MLPSWTVPAPSATRHRFEPLDDVGVPGLARGAGLRIRALHKHPRVQTDHHDDGTAGTAAALNAAIQPTLGGRAHPR